MKMAKIAKKTDVTVDDSTDDSAAKKDDTKAPAWMWLLLVLVAIAITTVFLPKIPKKSNWWLQRSGPTVSKPFEVKLVRKDDRLVIKYMDSGKLEGERTGENTYAGSWHDEVSSRWGKFYLKFESPTLAKGWGDNQGRNQGREVKYPIILYLR